MYWINAGSAPTIEKAHMDGRNQTTIIMGDVLNDPAVSSLVFGLGAVLCALHFLKGEVSPNNNVD